MKRRDFLHKSAAAGLSFSLLPSAVLRTQNPYIEQIGLQLYTVREQMAANPAGTLQAVKSAGYSQVEGGNPLAMQEMLPMVKDAGMYLQSSFFSPAYITERWDLHGDTSSKQPEVLIEAAEKYGLKYLVFGYLNKAERQSLDDYKRYADRLNRMGEKCEQAGVHLCYHNHSFEFGPIDGRVPYDVLIEEFDPSHIQFELDIFWVSLAGHAPEKLMKKMKGKIRLLHLKDKLDGIADEYDESKVSKDAFQELGDGVVDIRKVLKLAPKVGVEECFVEQDQSPDPLKSIAQSSTYLRDIQDKV
jgi:sugar phosphate isomerase/epimerase